MCARNLATQVGGTSIRIVGLANQLSDDHEVHVYSRGDLPEDANPGLTNHELDRLLTPPKYKKAAPFVPDIVDTIVGDMVYRTSNVDEVANRGFDIVHCHKHAHTHKISLVEDRFKAPVLFDMHGLLKSERAIVENDSIINSWSDKLDILFERYLVNEMEYVSTLSKEMTEYVVEEFGINERNVFTIPNGVNPDLFERVNDDRVKEIERKRSLTNKNIVMYVGGVSSLHATTDLLEAFKIVNSEIENVEFVLITRGPTERVRPEFERLTDDISNLQQWSPVPHEQLPTVLELADVLVSSYADNKFSDLIPHTKTLEYMASETPIVVSRTEGHNRMLSHMENAYLYTPEDPHSLAEGITTYLLNETMAREMAVNAKKEIANHTFERAARKAKEAYKYILSDYDADDAS
jgi:glycosyltransferase involved in cell wall biosynthesis